jgi:hypothetical protein
MWRDYATPACNAMRAKNPPPAPDADGLCDAAGVAGLCGRRQCRFLVESDLHGTVAHDGAARRLAAASPGRWDPVEILRVLLDSACESRLRD